MYTKQGETNSADDVPGDDTTPVLYEYVILAIVCTFVTLGLYMRHTQKVNKHKRDFDECIVKMTVLPHDEARILQSNDASRRSRACFTTLILKRCCIWKGKQAILPLAKSKEATQRTSSEQEDTRTDNYTDELELAEEGEGIDNDGETSSACAICLEQYRVGESVALSALGHCQMHVFHHDCLLEWAVLGKEGCPVCRETFWSAAKSGGKREGVYLKVLSQHQFCENHGLTLCQS